MSYPSTIDSQLELFEVKNSLKVYLYEDYLSGDLSIQCYPAENILKFPETGIITLTEQCSELDNRALSFFYESRDENGFYGLELLSEFTDSDKQKDKTSVTMNVMAQHHNAIKDSIVSIEEFAGKKDRVGDFTLAGTMEERVNYLRELVLKPKAYFEMDKTNGIVPLVVSFKDLSYRSPNKMYWDFGDSTSQDIEFDYIEGQAEGTTPSERGDVIKTYADPGVFTVSLNVESPYGTDVYTLTDVIKANTVAPYDATIEFIPTSEQIVVGNSIKTKSSEFVRVKIATNGELVDDPIAKYSWELGDELEHPNSEEAIGKYTFGGIYDLILRTDTVTGSYKITTFPNAIDVVESKNLFLSVFDPLSDQDSVSRNVYVYEFGLISETFKVRSSYSLIIERDAGFLTGDTQILDKKREFFGNTGWAEKNTVNSGDQGDTILYWAKGSADYSSSQNVKLLNYNAFLDIYDSPAIDEFEKSWNWTAMNTPQGIYFSLGTIQGTPSSEVDTSYHKYSKGSSVITGGPISNLVSGANDLSANADDNEYSVYRSCWYDGVGYIARNDAFGDYFAIKSFYKTNSGLNPFSKLEKIVDIPGAAKLEGELVPLETGLYFFDNSGNLSFYNSKTNVWLQGTTGGNTFALVQDTTLNDYDDPRNTLKAASYNGNAYLSFEYSNKAVVRYNEATKTYNKLASRPLGEQFACLIY